MDRTGQKITTNARLLAFGSLPTSSAKKWITALIIHENNSLDIQVGEPSNHGIIRKSEEGANFRWASSRACSRHSNESHAEWELKSNFTRTAR